ncbi:sulfur carrier protein ThiS [Anoxynatronum buryatiense]|uniref:Sulfur carrier protein n=1 Tax=Anoxynatronum buryatiense TaxID=489973 RepID=A0AA46AHR3_9CLOT|nr:sulfur carrier protein ThiS [Anoxynatronum buryatiense]SMP41403.1 sulfur carrier protein [Anoxynatronum buryatiense]
MRIVVNGESVETVDNAVVIQVLEQQQTGRNVAVWVNERRLLQKEYPTFLLHEGDHLRVLKPLGGG